MRKEVQVALPAMAPGLAHQGEDPGTDHGADAERGGGEQGHGFFVLVIRNL